ncbi:B3 domain-containing transcription factor VRN1-like [Arachis stenosperma]|uniref:B3 domain-containing transcription factor VRN1-like n=1 Tax=Arachis stenosperma TaxID=217475 RepID=UPI0025ABEACD|nr:B3 domain-containing transcription factor VRN1-like [Arachis stenosperma]
MSPHHQICFFQILAHNKFYQKLMIPKCANEYWKRMSNPIKLVLPCGSVERKVMWTKRGENIWLEQGWEKVVELCGLSYEWLLTFDYNGRSSFEVKVYDTTGLRVAYYNFDEYDVENNKDVDETESDDDDDDDDNDDDDDDDEDGDDDFAEDYCDEEYHHYEFVQEHFKRKKTNIVNGSNRNPSFKIRIQESYVESRCVAIPATFARKHLEEGPIRMIVGNRAWTVCYKTWRGRARYRKHKLQSGWLRFRRENNLEVGDVCVFELISKFPQTMIVRMQSG